MIEQQPFFLFSQAFTIVPIETLKVSQIQKKKNKDSEISETFDEFSKY